MASLPTSITCIMLRPGEGLPSIHLFFFFLIALKFTAKACDSSQASSWLEVLLGMLHVWTSVDDKYSQQHHTGNNSPQGGFFFTETPKQRMLDVACLGSCSSTARATPTHPASVSLVVLGVQ